MQQFFHVELVVDPIDPPVSLDDNYHRKTFYSNKIVIGLILKLKRKGYSSVEYPWWKARSEWLFQFWSSKSYILLKGGGKIPYPWWRRCVGWVWVTKIDGEPWIVAKDVCTSLGILDHTTATRFLDDDEKGAQSLRTLGGDQVVSMISEAGMYKIVMRSNKKEAKAFQRWVTHKVLPAIRETGMYAINKAGHIIYTAHSLSLYGLAMGQKRCLCCNVTVTAL